MKLDGIELKFQAASRNLHRHASAQIMSQLVFFGMGLAFWFAGKAMDKPVMSASVYGAVGDYPAEMWAGAVMISSATYLAGIIINGQWRWSAGLRLLGCLMQIAVLFALIFSAWGALHGTHLVIWSGSALAMHIWLLVLNIGDFGRALRWGA